MKRKRISRVGVAGILAVISAFGLVAILSLSNGALRNINPTEQQQTVDAIVRMRLTQTAEMRLSATPEVTEIDPIWQTATAVYILSSTNLGSSPVPGTPPTIDARLPIATDLPRLTSETRTDQVATPAVSSESPTPGNP